MASEDAPTGEIQGSSNDAERKLWFDYLAKLNDRELQSARASGFTPWALLAVVAATVYAAAPKIPSFVSTPGAVTTSLVTLALETDVLFFEGLFILSLMAYCAPRVHSRLAPERSERASSIVILTGRILITALAAAHFVAAFKFTGTAIVRWMLVILGVWWLYNLHLGVRTGLRSAREAKKLGPPAVSFSVTRGATLIGSPVGAAVVFTMGILPLATLIAFLHRLAHEGISWVAALGAATDVLVVLGVVAALFLMAIHSASRGIFLALERDILLENLSASEIRNRFIKEALGRPVGDWIESAYEKVREAFQILVGVRDSIAQRLQEIEGIDPQFALERAGRAQKALDELEAAIKTYSEEADRFRYQMQQLSKVVPSTWDAEIVRGLAERQKAEQGSRIGDASAVRELRERLRKLAGKSR
jgi:hypothetical protein